MRQISMLKPATKSEGLSSTPKTHIKEVENQLLL